MLAHAHENHLSGDLACDRLAKSVDVEAPRGGELADGTSDDADAGVHGCRRWALLGGGTLADRGAGLATRARCVLLALVDEPFGHLVDDGANLGSRQ